MIQLDRLRQLTTYRLVILFVILTILVVGFHLISPILFDIIPVLEPYSASNQLVATSILATFLLTFSLLAVYIRISELQRMERRSIIEIANYEFEDDKAIVWLSNYGSGSATNLQLVLDMRISGETNVSAEISPTSLHRADKSMRRIETSIPPHKELIRFKSIPRVQLDGENFREGKLHFALAMDKLARKEIDSAEFTMSLRYSNQLNETNQDEIMPYYQETEIEPRKTLEDAWGAHRPSEDDRALLRGTAYSIHPPERLLELERYSPTGVRILQVIKEYPSGVAPSEVDTSQNYPGGGDASTVVRPPSKPIIEAIVEGLEKDRLIEREQSESPPRETVLKITDRGEEMLNLIAESQNTP